MWWENYNSFRTGDQRLMNKCKTIKTGVFIGDEDHTNLSGRSNLYVLPRKL